jgi:hypothetical protein
MSVSNLLAPNNYELYINTLHVNNIIGITGSTGPIISPLYTNFIDTPPGGSASLAIGPTNERNINIGNVVGYTQYYGRQLMPSLVGPAYEFNDSLTEIFGTAINFTGLVTASTAGFWSFRRIGNWVDVYVNCGGFSVNSGTTGNLNSSLNIAGLLPTGYQPASNIICPAVCINNGSSVAGLCLVTTSGGINFSLSGTSGNYSTGTGNVGANNLLVSFHL